MISFGAATFVSIDHMHVFVSAPPRFSPAWIANLLKGFTARELRKKFPFLKKKCGKDRLWTSSYYVGKRRYNPYSSRFNPTP